MNTDILWIRSSVFFSKCNHLMIFIQNVWSVDSPLHFICESCSLHFRSIDAFDILNSEHWLSECGRRAKQRKTQQELNTVDFAIRNRNSMSTPKKKSRVAFLHYTYCFLSGLRAGSKKKEKWNFMHCLCCSRCLMSLFNLRFNRFSHIRIENTKISSIEFRFANYIRNVIERKKMKKMERKTMIF